MGTNPSAFALAEAQVAEQVARGENLMGALFYQTIGETGGKLVFFCLLVIHLFYILTVSSLIRYRLQSYNEKGKSGQ